MKPAKIAISLTQRYNCSRGQVSRLRMQVLGFRNVAPPPAPETAAMAKSTAPTSIVVNVLSAIILAPAAASAPHQRGTVRCEPQPPAAPVCPTAPMTD